MTAYFLDSSALVKRYVIETGTNWISSITDSRAGNAIIISQITQAEVVSAVMRRKRDGTITPRSAHAIRLLVDRHANRDYQVVALTRQIIQRAEDLLETYSLRAYDSIQLASALDSNTRLLASGLPPLTFLSADIRLITVAISEGLTTDDPNAHP